MTCEAGKTGRDAASVASRPGSVDAAVQTLFAQLRLVVYLWAGEQRIDGSLQAHDSFDGLLTEHVQALEDARSELAIALDAMRTWDVPRKQRLWRALELLDEEIKHVRSLGSVAEPRAEDEQR